MGAAIQTVAAIWGLIGASVALPFLAMGAARVLEAARGSSIAFRVLIFPGCVVLWPWVLARWVGAAKGNRER